MSMEGSKSFVPQEAVGGPKKEAAPKYNPMVSVRRDFDPEQIYREKGRAVIDDADHRQIMAFYRGAIVPGILLDLGAGPTHLHFMGCLEDKLTHIIALDLSKDNLRVVAEFLDSVGPEAKIAKGQRKFISDTDLRILKITAEASANVGKRTDKARSGESVLKSIREKSLDRDGVQGDVRKHRCKLFLEFRRLVLGAGSSCEGNAGHVFHKLQVRASRQKAREGREGKP